MTKLRYHFGVVVYYTFVFLSLRTPCNGLSQRATNRVIDRLEEYEWDAPGLSPRVLHHYHYHYYY